MGILKRTNADVHIFLENYNGPSDISIKNERIFFHFNEITPIVTKNLPSSKRWPSIVYCRIFAPYVLENYDRLLYLDADTLVVKNVDFLMEFDMKGNTLAATHDGAAIGPLSAHGTEPKEDWLQSIGITTGRYLNAGILVIDQKKFTKFDLGAEMVSYFDQYRLEARLFDQDFINFFFQNDWIELSPKYNFQMSLFNFGLDGFFDPAIIHFSDKLERVRRFPIQGGFPIGGKNAILSGMITREVSHGPFLQPGFA